MKDLMDRRSYKQILIDGMNMVYMHYHGQSNLSYHGKKTGMLFGIARLVTKMQREYTGAEIVFLWEGTNSRRKLISDDYKSHRSEKPNEFHEQVDEVKQFLSAAGVRQMYHIGLEADDLAGYLCSISDEEILLVSSDADWMQFMREDRIDMMRGMVETFADIHAALGFPPNKMGMWKILKGDKSDGISGIYRFPSSVARLLVNKCSHYKEFRDYPLREHNPAWEKWERTLEEVWEEVVVVNAELVLFHEDWINQSQIVDKKSVRDVHELHRIYKENGFKSLMKSLDEH